MVKAKAVVDEKPLDEKTQKCLDFVSDFVKSRKISSEVLVKVLSRAKLEDIPAISTAIPALDLATGIDGFPQGKYTIIHGPESSGKTSLVIASLIKFLREHPDEVGAIVDMENAIEASTFALHGVKINISNESDTAATQDPIASRIIWIQPTYGEDAVDMVAEMIETKQFGMIILDSIAACANLRENNEKRVSENHRVGGHPALMGKLVSRISPVLNKGKTVLVMINQERDNLNAMAGSPIALPGGKGLRFFASMILRVQRIGNVMQSDKILGIKIKAKINKNKLSAPFRVAEFSLYFDGGFDDSQDMIEKAVEKGLVQKDKRRFQWKDELYFMQDLCIHLRANPEQANELRQMLITQDAGEDRYADEE